MLRCLQESGPPRCARRNLGDCAVLFTGRRPLRQYLIGVPGGRLQALQIAWDVPRRRWFHLLPDERAPAGDVLHWTGRYQTANTSASPSHDRLREALPPANDCFGSHWSEPTSPARPVTARGTSRALGPTSSEPSARDTDGPQVEMCAPCHSRRSDLQSQHCPEPHDSITSYRVS